MFRRTALAAAIISVILLVIAFGVWAIWGFVHVCISCGAPEPNYWDVTVAATATYDPTTKAWTVAETFTIPSRDALQQIVTDTDHSLDSRAKTMRSQKLAELLRRHITNDRWSLVAFRNGLPVFQRETLTVPAHVNRLPLHTTLEILLPNVGVVKHRVYLIPGKGSQLIVNTPSGMVSSTDPPGTRSDVAGGDRWVVPLYGATFASPGARLEAVSPLVRQPPLRNLADISYAGATGWILTALVGFVTGLFKTQVNSVVDPKVDALLVKLKIKKKSSVTKPVSGSDVADASQAADAPDGQLPLGGGDAPHCRTAPAERETSREDDLKPPH
jgi:hypothetical protein